jgi:hypothetical protein
MILCYQLTPGAQATDGLRATSNSQSCYTRCHPFPRAYCSGLPSARRSPPCSLFVRDAMLQVRYWSIMLVAGAADPPYLRFVRAGPRCPGPVISQCSFADTSPPLMQF